MANKSRYLMMVIDSQTAQCAATFDPGSKAETAIVDEVIDRIHLANVGWFQSQQKVEIAVRKAIVDTIHALKNRVEPGA